MAHELNQPLAAILSNAQAAQLLLARNPPDLEETRAIMTDIVSDDLRAGEVIQRLRSLRSEEHTSELQSLMRISYAVFCLKKKQYMTIKIHKRKTNTTYTH